jgi:hypothetical protein
VHLFACAFYRIKREFTPDPEQVELFYSSRNVDQNVRYEAEWGWVEGKWYRSCGEASIDSTTIEIEEENCCCDDSYGLQDRNRTSTGEEI